MDLCAHRTVIEVRDNGDGVLSIRIDSSCAHVVDYARLLTAVTMEDICILKGSKIIDLASNARLTPTCLVPSGVFNACWLETGMISRNLVKSRPKICINFLD